MRRLFHGLWLGLVVVALLAAACGSSKPANVTPPANSANPATTVPGTGGGVTTKCTIPQNNGGDHDSDNNGGPDDGDGCDV